MPYKEKDIEKKYYTIGEVADMFKVATSLIRFWESEFDTIRPRKNSKGNRQYTKEDIEQIKLVYHLVKERGYTLQGANEIIKAKKNKAMDNLELVKSLEKIKAFLVELRNKIE
ncbi:MAG: MerR family transcriptional regulator [Cytophagaceae bacterium]